MKNLLIAGVVGLLFMSGSFWIGLRLAPIPPPQPKTPPVQAQAAASAKPDPIGPEALKKTSETMMTLNQAIEAREQSVAAREQKAKQREEELDAERAALDRSHEKFRVLYGEFQQRLQLVEASQLDELQKQATLYAAMGTTQSIDLIRAMDDASMTRLFSVMDVKPLGKLVAEWKTKYPNDTERLLRALDGMAQVMPKEKIELSAAATAPDSAAPANPAPAANETADNSTPASTPDSTPAAQTDSNTMPANQNSAPAPNASSAPVSTPDSTSTPATPPAPASPSTPPAPASPSTPALQPPPDSSPAPVSTATAN